MKVIGICGPSCTGKSTLTGMLVKKLNANAICLDRFYIHGSKKIYIDYKGAKLRTFERPEIYNGQRLANVVKTLKKIGKARFSFLNIKTFKDEIVSLKRKDFLIIEGFLLYNYPELNQVIDYHFYIDLSFSEILKRRMKRNDRPLADEAFRKVGRSEQEKYCEPQKNLPFVIVLDGRKSPEKLCSEILEKVLKSDKGDSQWVTVERPGYLGKKKNCVHDSWDKKYGKGNWRIAYEWGKSVITKEKAIELYEEAYYVFFKKNPDILNWLTSTASDVYDTAPSNVNSGLNYEIQETVNNHIHDIAIRRAVAHLGKKFIGNRSVHVRWTDSQGFRINPGVVPFHKPRMIVSKKVKDYGKKGIWWHPKTIEDFYQRNKILQVKKK